MLIVSPYRSVDVNPNLTGEMLGFWSSQAHSSLEGLEFYLRTLEAFISSEKRNEITELEEAAGRLTEEQQSEFWAWHYPVHWEEIFATQLRSSFLVTLVSLVESHLSTVAKEAKGIARVPLGPREIQGDHIERHHKYLEKVLAFQSPSNSLWSDICDLSEVRNRIVHAQSSVFAENPKQRDRLEHLAKKLPGVSIEYSVYQFGEAFPVFALGRVREFVSELYREAGSLLKRSVYWQKLGG